MELSPSYIFNIVRRWLLLLLVATLVASAASYWVSKQRPRVYQAKARLIVGPGLNSPNPDLNALRTGGQLMQTYAELVTTRPVLQGVIDDLGLVITPDILEKNIKVKSDDETQILTISVVDGDPEQAAAIANAFAETLVRLSPAGAGDAEARRKAQIQSEIEKLQETMTGTEIRIEQLEADLRAASEEGPDPVAQAIVDSTEARITQLETDLQSATDVDTQRLILDQIAVERNRLFDAQRIDKEKQSVLRNQIEQERSRLFDAHRTLAQLYESLGEGSTNQIKIIEPAVVAKPVASQLRLNVLVASVAGLLLAVAIALSFEFFDDTIKTAQELAQVTGVPLVGAITKHENPKGSGRDSLVVQALPELRASEDYRMLGTKLLFSNGGRRLRSVMISAPQSDDSIGEVAANVVVTLAQAGSRIILVDANLRSPTLGQLFGLGERPGLAELLMGRAQQPELVQVAWMPGLSILPAGRAAPSNPFELLASPAMLRLVEQLEDRADLVIIVTSSIESFADGLVLASRVDGVLLVARRGKTRRKAVGTAIEQLHSLGAHIVGTVLSDSDQGGVGFVSSRHATAGSTVDGRLKNKSPVSRRFDDVEYETGAIAPIQTGEL